MLHATIHALGQAAIPAGPLAGAGVEVAPLTATIADLQPLSVTFETVAAALEALPRMYFEPDGSFVWVGEAGERSWQLEGQLQDRGERLDHVEIKGTCAREDFIQFLGALRGAGTPLVFQLVRSAVVIDERAALQLATPR